MKSSSFDSTCTTMYTPSDPTITTGVIRNEVTINHDFTDESTIWPGLNQQYINDYAVNWDGYIETTKSSYEFNLTTYGGGALYIDGKLIISNYGCGEININTGTADLGAGKHPIRVVYTKYRGGSGIKLSINSPSNIDINNILYYTQSELDYEYHGNTYYIGKEFSNSPVYDLEEGDSINTANSVPVLPDGVNIGQNNGVITGTATNNCVTKKRLEYTITITTSKGKTLSAVIYMTFESSLAPEGIYFIDAIKGTIADLTTLNLGDYYKFLLSTEIGFASKFVINNIPYGWEYNNDNKMLSGVTSAYFKRKDISISAYDTEENSNTEIILFDVNNICDDSNRYTIKLSSSNTEFILNLEIKLDDEIKYTGNKLLLPVYSSFCYKEGVHKMTINNDVSFTGSFNIDFYVDGNLVDTVTVVENVYEYTVTASIINIF